MARRSCFFAQQEGLEINRTQDFKALTGLGIEAGIDGAKVLAGNRKLMLERGVSLEELEQKSGQLADEGKTPMFIARGNKLFGILAVADVVKPSSRAAIESLHEMNIEVVMITGDNFKTARRHRKTSQYRPRVRRGSSAG